MTEWKRVREKIISTEDAYMRRDFVIDVDTEELIIVLNYDSNII